MNIRLYGTDWCADCKLSQRWLDENCISYEYINIDTVPGAADTVATLNGGLKSIPTILFPDGSVLVEPSNNELLAKVALLSRPD